MSLSDKKIVIFGSGEQKNFSDNFCDATAELYDYVTAQRKRADKWDIPLHQHQ